MTTDSSVRSKEIYKYAAPWPVYAMNWSYRPDHRFRLAIGSFVEEYSNKIQIVSLSNETGDFEMKSQFDHPYPSTRINWIPDSTGQLPDLLATSGDYLRIWHVNGNEVKLETLLNNNKASEFCAPLTSFDWNEVDLQLIGTCSIDTTCTIWSIETGQAMGRTKPTLTGSIKTQLIAHDKEVYDIAFSKSDKGRDLFISCGADGSIRLFDLRNLEHSTILYEDPHHKALLRLAWNKQDSNYISAIAIDSTEVNIIDIRASSTPVGVLQNHQSQLNGISWAPHSSCHICTASDDKKALIWDIQQISRPIEDPLLAYQADGEINQVHWSMLQPDWIAICYKCNLEILRV